MKPLTETYSRLASCPSLVPADPARAGSQSDVWGSYDRFYIWCRCAQYCLLHILESYNNVFLDTLWNPFWCLITNILTSIVTRKTNLKNLDGGWLVYTAMTLDGRSFGGGQRCCLCNGTSFFPNLLFILYWFMSLCFVFPFLPIYNNRSFSSENSFLFFNLIESWDIWNNTN